MEAAGLGAFMISACFFASLLEYPGSPVRGAVQEPFVRRSLMGLAMGLTAVGVIYSPWGQQSGAHINPAVTLTFFRLGKIKPWDATFYVVAQFLGGLAGVVFSVLVISKFVSHPSVNYVATVPNSGLMAAFVAEMAMSFGLMFAVLYSSNSVKWSHLTGVIAGIMVALYITLEAPISGMSINPARSFASALPARLWTAFWIYLLAPPIGMLLAAKIYRVRRGLARVFCAKLNHHTKRRCIFHCGYGKTTNA